jgi:4-amino-4-deoxy-L-arabinose transferase-like glycosyltransferase
MELGQRVVAGRKLVIAFAVLVAAGVMSGWKAGKGPLEGHECFVTVTAREMIAGGDWVVPHYNGEVRLEKTPLNYWMAGAVGMVRGRVDAIAGRLPSAVLAVVSAGAILYFASGWFRFRVAMLGALVWCTSMCFIRYGRSARPEMSLVCFVTIAMLSFYAGLVAKERRRQIAYMAVFWASFGAAMLAKGPAPLVLVWFPLACYFAVFRKWKLVGKVLPIAGVAIFLLIVLPWPVAVLMKLWGSSGGEGGVVGFWQREFVGRFMGEHNAGGKAFYYYVPYVFWFLFPWSGFVVMILAAPFYKVWGKRAEAMWFLWFWLVGDVLIMSLSGGKRMHYILGGMPAGAILIGVVLDDMIYRRVAYSERFARNMLLGHVGAMTAGVVVCLYLAVRYGGFYHKFAGLSIVVLGGMAVVVGLFARKKNDTAIRVLFGGMCIAFMAGYGVVEGMPNYNRNAEVFAGKVASVVGAKGKLVAYGDVSERFVHHYGRKVRVEVNARDIYTWYSEGVKVMASGRFMDELLADGRFRVLARWDEMEREGDGLVAGAVFGRETGQ